MWITAYKKVEFAPFFYAHSWSDYCYWYLSQIQTEFDELEAKGDIDKWEQTLNQRSVELNEMHAKVNCDALIPNDCRRILDLLNNNTEFEKRVFVEGQKAKIQLARFGVPLSPNYNVMLDRTENEKLLIKHLAEIRDETDPESRIDAAISQLHEVLLPLTIGEKNSSKSPYNQKMVRETHDKIDFMRSQLDFNEGQVLQWHQELEQRVYIDTSSVDVNTSWAEEMTKHVEMVMSAAYRYCPILDHRMMELEGAEKLMKGNKIEEKRRDKLFLERFSEVAAKFEQVSFERAMFLAKTIQKEEKS